MSNTPVGQLLLSIGSELGRSPDQMQPVIQKIVAENWYDSIESLQSVTEEQWKSFGLPQRLLDKVRERLSGEVTSGPVIVELAGPPDNSVLVSILIESIQIETDSAESFHNCLSTISTILGNILSESVNEKYRKVRISNPKFQSSVAKFPSAISLLKSAGFVLDGEYYRCNVLYLSRFTDIHNSISDAIEAIGVGPRPELPVSLFNPFKESVANAGDTFGVPKGRLAVERQTELEEVRREAEEIKRKLNEAKGEPLSRPVVVRLPPIEKKDKKKKKKSVDSWGDEVEDQNLLMSNLRSIMSLNDAKFKSREKAELEKLKARQNNCTVRLSFADRVNLEFVVSPGESVCSVYKIVNNCLSDEWKGKSDWVLTVSPPLRRLERNGKTTMVHEGFVPNVIMRIMCDGRQLNSDVLSSNYL